MFINTSCEEWLDVQPANNITENDLFEGSYGFRTSINALYQKMADPKLYGLEFSSGFVDILSRQYDLTGRMNHYLYKDLNAYKFETDLSRSVIDAIWDKSYNIISNANNIIKNIQEKPDDFFEMGVAEKNLIEGEALAVRALLHFDLLRLYAPAPVSDDKADYIPYVSDFPVIRPLSTSVDKCIENIIDDLETAEKLTLTHDTTDIGLDAVRDADARFLENYKGSLWGNSGDKVNIFFKNRGYRLHNDAIVALLARAYQYAGMHEKALDYAEKIINKESEDGKVYDFDYSGIDHSSAISDFNSLKYAWESKTNLRLLKNLIFAVYDQNLYTKGTISVHFSKNLVHSTTTPFFNINREKHGMFLTADGTDESKVDIRSKYLIFDANDWKNPVSGKWFVHTDYNLAQTNFNILPMIRLTEMYYIAAESYARAGDFTKAKELLMKVRNERACTKDIVVTNLDEFKQELIRDARREWISEGQLFYLYKRLNVKVDFYDGQAPRQFSRKESLIPIPQNQSI